MMRMISSLVALLLILPFVPAHSAAAQSTPDGDLAESRAGFSRSMVVHGGSVYVGEPANNLRPGTVYVYGRSASGDWAETARVTSGDSFMGDGFGTAMAAFGDLMAVTATDQDDGRGAVYIFDIADGGAQEIARLSPTDTSEVTGFGSSVAMGEGTLVVGANNVDEEAGSAYVFERDENGVWAQTARLRAEDVEAGHLFGAAVAMHAGDILIGAPGTDRSAGAVYVYAKDDGAWTEIDDISERDLERNDAFGVSMTVADGRAYIAAPYTERNIGRVYIYEKAEDGDWDDVGRLLPFDSQSNLRFGASIGVTETAVWVGAPGADSFQGAVYAASRNEHGVYTGVEKMRAAEPASGSRFAGSIAVSGDVAAVGAPGLNSGAGGVVIFEYAEGAWTAVTAFEPPIDALDSMTGGETFCEDGEAGLFECEQVDMLSFLSVKDVGAEPGIQVNDVWGWTDPETGREFAIVGRNDGTSFIDVSDPLNPVYLGNLDKTEGSNTSTWRDMKVYSNHVYIVADGAGQHGMQVFDLTRLRDLEEIPVDFDADAHYDNIASAHNIVINEESGYGYAVGASSGGETCGGGLHMINLEDPVNPTFAGCFSDAATGRAGTGYSHDAMCIQYNGPDQEYVGEEICFGANETALSIANVSDKENPIKVSSAEYPNVGYSHQGWITEDHRYFFSNDELDELQGKASQTRTLIWDVTDLDDPQLVKEYMAPTKSSDHNLYIKGNLMYQSNYVAGLRVLDISDPENPVEVAHFDTVPYGTNDPGFNGSWSNYPYFESGTIIVTSGREGVFLLKKREVDI